jgi:pilus assembly protein CpaF
MPVRAIREQIASAIDMIVHQDRFRDGSRKVTHITDVQGMEGDIIVMQDIFHFEQAGFEGGKVIGQLKPTGIRPKFMDKIEAAGLRLPANVFGLGERFRY